MNVPNEDELLEDDDELLFRQIHPNCVEEDGEPSSAPFHPTTKDKNKLSVDRSSLTTAEESYLRHRERWESDAVYGVTVGEFKDEEIPCLSNPLKGNGAHVLANYRGISKNQQKKKAKRLRDVAVKRGKLHPPPQPQ